MRTRVANRATRRKGGKSNSRGQTNPKFKAFSAYMEFFWSGFKHWRNVSAAPMVMRECAKHPAEFRLLAMRTGSSCEAIANSWRDDYKLALVCHRRSNVKTDDYKALVVAFNVLHDQGNAETAVLVMREYSRNPEPFVRLAINYVEGFDESTLPSFILPPSPTDNLKRFRVSCTLSTETAELLRSMAKIEGVTVSEYARRLLRMSFMLDGAAISETAGSAPECERVPAGDVVAVFNYEGGEIVGVDGTECKAKAVRE
jgi:hypothetical protein